MPYLLLLDEMNLAHVERYFSDFLSGVESRAAVVPNLQGERMASGGAMQAQPRIPVPRNLVVVGTVNVDETTYQFSPKVLDRAFTFEVRTTTERADPNMRRPVQPRRASRRCWLRCAEAACDDTWQGRDAPAALAEVAQRGAAAA